MSETPVKKLNLKALKQNKTTETEAPNPEIGESIIAEEKKETPIAAPKKDEIIATKMSFASIRKEVKEEKQVSPPSIDEKKEEKNIISDTIVEEKNQETQESVEEKKSLATEEIPVGNKKQHKENVEAKKIQKTEEKSKKKRKGFFGIFKSKKNTKVQEKSKEAPLINYDDTKKENKEEKIINFKNYESYFKKESSNFISRFQNFKYTPQTRLGLIVGLISITIIIIGSLMVFMPDKHSPEIYKASILYMINGDAAHEDIIKDTTHQVFEIQADTKNIPVETNEKEKDIQDFKATKIEASKEKLKQHLLEKYSHN